MRCLVVSQREVPALLPMADCIEAMAGALRTLAAGDARLPLRPVIALPDGGGALAVMPAYLGGPPAIGLKAITVFPGNHGTVLDSHQGAVLLFDAERGSLLAIVDASSVTAIRTAAVSAVATRLLAREDAGDLALLGTGVQAMSHLEAMAQVRTLRRVRAFSRDPRNVQALVRGAQARLGLRVEAASSAREAVLGADIVCATTASRTPVLEGAWLSPGAHVNAVGASVKDARELDTAAVASARLYVDRRESALAEAGDFLIPKAEGAIGDDHIQAELGDVLLGARPGRRSRDEITLFKSLGLAVEDVAAARVIYANAVAAGAGSWVELGGERNE
ncbi:MAG TPA: ornithine cyclodeaminase family protein [Vicinamibacteria bacterium]|nr:ornithine cyclodeaminase family protein [Vicinamibacteria bacterium]